MENEGLLARNTDETVSESLKLSIQAGMAALDAARTIVEKRVRELTQLSAEQTDAKGLETTLTQLAKALQTLNSEKGKLEDAERIQRGGDGLDLDAARSEIESRLDRICAARDTAGVS